MDIPQSVHRAKTRYLHTRGPLVIAAVAWLTPAALAQTTVPARDGNRWNGISHQPTRAAIAAQERQAGVALTDEQKRQEDQELDRVARSLLQNADRSSQ